MHPVSARKYQVTNKPIHTTLFIKEKDGSIDTINHKQISDNKISLTGCLKRPAEERNDYIVNTTLSLTRFNTVKGLGRPPVLWCKTAKT